ncbi:MAG TPA: class I SAM-dependent methyltransferase [Pyrinomonadaceae bacterium]|jgi:SAM-dependent methyltransferase
MADKEQRDCPGCHGLKSVELGEKNNFLMLNCKTCRSIYSSHLPIDGEKENYDEYYTEENLQVPEFIQKRLGEIIEDFSPYFSSGRLLDIGFGSAVLMQVARDKGWQPSGLEVSAPAVEHAKKLGFEVFHGDLTEAKYPDNHFDVIAASEIIEHYPEPEVLLREVMRILRPGGLFWATTPSAKGLSYRLTGLDWTVICPPEHLQLFSKKAVRLMFEKAGFSDLKIQTFGFNPLEIINTYRSRLNRKNEAEKTDFNRVGTSYALNEGLTKNSARQKIKNLLNGTLNFLSIGDSLKIKAVK